MHTRHAVYRGSDEGETGLTEDLYNHVNSVDTFKEAQQAGRLWVAVAPSNSASLVMEIAGYAHLDELDVLPQHGQKGVGSALLDAVCSWASNEGYPAITLRTFRDVPWNGPFYAHRGFRIVDTSSLSKEHVELDASERRRGLRTDLRVTMTYPTL